MAQYVVAGGSTVSGIIKSLIENGHLTVESANNFIKKTTDLYLTSIGECLNKKQQNFNKDRFVNKVVKLYDKTYKNDHFKSAGKVVDSGGYQISIGYINKDNIPEFIDAYFDLLHHPSVGQSCRYMLSLDIVGDKPTFDSKGELDKFNRMFLDRCIQEPQDVLDRVYFVYHFINPRLEELWWKFVEDYGTYFNNYSIGGLVAFSRGASFPFSIYSLPLLKLIKFKELKQILKPFSFHILGVSSFTDIVSFIIIEKALQKVYGIDVDIKFDSTRVLRETSIGKTFPFYYNGRFIRVSYKPSDLHTRVIDSHTNADIVKYVLEYMNQEFNFNVNIPERITPEVLYHDNGKGQAVRQYECTMILASIASIQKVVDEFNDEAKEVVESWYNGQITKSESLVKQMIEQASFNKRTKTTTFKVRSILNTLEFIKKDPTIETLNQLLKKTMEGVQEFKIFDKPHEIELSNLELF